MNSFWILTPIIGLLAVAVILVPLLRAHFVKRATDTRPGLTIGTGIVVALLVPASAILLYAKWTSWNWSAPAASAGMSAQQQDAHSMDDAIVGLEQRLAENPDDAAGWSMLGRSYVSLNQFDKAAQAFLQVVKLTGGDPTARADYAESLAMSDPAGLEGEAGEIFRELVKTNEDNPKVLWYGGIIAFDDGDTAEGQRLWSAILKLNPPDSLRQIVEQRLAETGAPVVAVETPAETTAETPTEPQPAATESVAQTPAPEVVPAQQPVPANPDGSIELSISLGEGLANRVSRNAPLFIFARGAAGGPPLVVVRRSFAELPLALTLSDANAMTEGVHLADHDPLVLVARLSLSGQPGANSGDLFGEVPYSRSSGPGTEIVIDQIVP
ncbi:MAG: TPR domain-containing protein [Gammaproteobacteria bacterium]